MATLNRNPAGAGGAAAPRADGSTTLPIERHLVTDRVAPAASATVREKFEALARSVRDLLVERWVATDAAHGETEQKRVYYLSMEFMIGRTLTNTVVNLGADPLVKEAAARIGFDPVELAEAEPDAGTGNGGLGRLAACYLDSLATLGIPAVGHGLRYEFGMFRQEIRDGAQVERPDCWLDRPDPWEVERPYEAVEVTFAGRVRVRDGKTEVLPDHPFTVRGIPHDRPVVGAGGKTVNTLRLWRATVPGGFDLEEFDHGDFFGAMHDRTAANTLTRVLYPDDSTDAGRRLRFAQEYFLVACAVGDIVRPFRAGRHPWAALPDKAAVQLNDTHPALAVPELLRILLDEARLPWDEAWDITTRTLGYTNHTLLPEALEAWPVDTFELLLPRHLEIVYEVNRRFLDGVRAKHAGDDDLVRRVSVVEGRRVRMAHLAVVGTHSTNGVSAIHSKLLRTRTMKDMADLFPERFGNVTNGVTPRRWLEVCNPALSAVITDAVGSGWVTDLGRLRKLAPLATDSAFRERFRQAKRAAKTKFVDWLKANTGVEVDPDTLFDCQVKRIHEYKRQLLNVLHVINLYDRLRADPDLAVPPRTVFFAGKAAPGYALAKLIIRLINAVAATIEADPAVRGRLRVLFLAEYNVSLAERLIPAADLSEQISTAGFEASGTSNMKFMLNGALTIGTRDGATIEMAEEAGEENLFLFGLTADQVEASKGWYKPWWHYEHDPAARAALDAIAGRFSPGDEGVFRPVWDALLTNGDRYMHLADFADYLRAHADAESLYVNPDGWAERAIRNVAAGGKFSSDRAVGEYARNIWGVKSCPVP